MAVNVGGTDTKNADQASARQTALSRGYSAAEIDPFIAKEGGERTSSSRILTAFAPRNAAGEGSAMPSNQSAEGLALNGPGTGGSTGGGMPGAGGGSPQAGGSTVIDKAPENPALAGLTSALGDSGGGSGGGGSVGLTQANSTVGFSGSGLRAGLGGRAYPQDTYALAALRKAY